MSKNKTDNFLSKFSNRVEKVGRDGVMGLMKSTGLPVNNIYQNYSQSHNNNSSSRFNDSNELNKNNFDYDNYDNYPPRLRNPNKNIYNTPIRNSAILNIKNNSNFNNNNNNRYNSKYQSSKSIFPLIRGNQSQNNENIIFKNRSDKNNSFKNPLFYSYNNNNYINLRNNNFNNSMNYPYLNERNNNNQNLLEFPTDDNTIVKRKIYSVVNNRQNIVDYGYTPYTLKDYKKINNEVKLGKLGPNLGTKEWEEKRKRMKKMSEYGNKVMHEGKGCYVKVAESAEERHKRLQEMKAISGKWNIINEYSRGLMINSNKNSNERFKRNVNEKLMEEERLLDRQYEMDMEEEDEKERMQQQQRNLIYQKRLNKMKNLLFN